MFEKCNILTIPANTANTANAANIAILGYFRLF